MVQDLNAVFYSHTYHPIQAGSIDGTDTAPHDNAVYRAMLATSTGLYDPLGDPKAQGDPYCTVFVGRLSKDTTEETIEKVMSEYGKIKSLRLVRHIVTGASQGYAFVEYETEKDMRYAYESAHRTRIDGMEILVDYNRQILMPGWIPRRLGGGLGGRKESGQLRFGGRDRPFRKPLRPIPDKELEKLGIPLPGNYMHRFEVPPLPRRKQDKRHTQELVPKPSLKESINEDDEKRQHNRRHERRHSYYEDENVQEYNSENRQHRRWEERQHSYHEGEASRLKDNDTKLQQRGNAKTNREIEDDFRSSRHQEHSRGLETNTEDYQRQHRTYDLKLDESDNHERREKDIEVHEKDTYGDVKRHERSHKRHHSKQGSDEREHSERYEREDGKKRHKREYGHEADNAKAHKSNRAEKDYSDEKDKAHHHRKHDKTVEDVKRDKHQKTRDRTNNEKGHDESRGHKRSHRSRSSRTPDTESYHTDKRSKSRRYESRETTIDDRWNP